MELSKMKGTPAEQEGIWFKWEDAKLKVASINSKRYQRILQDKQAPYRAQIRRGTLPDETREELATEAMAEAILLDWEGVKENGKAISYSVAAAKELLTKYQKFAALVAEFAMNEAAFQAELDEEGISSLKKD
jgi:hypothetical protein